MRDRDPFGPDTPVSVAVDFAVLAGRYTKIPLTPRLNNLVKQWINRRSMIPEDRKKMF